MSTVLVFGAFDPLHQGHEYLFEQAKKFGDSLIVGVARDGFIKQIKGREPREDQKSRLVHIKQHPTVLDAVLCDEENGSFHMLEEIKPDVICLGYDQSQLRESLQKWMNDHGVEISIYILDSYKPEIYKSSLL